MFDFLGPRAYIELVHLSSDVPRLMSIHTFPLLRVHDGRARRCDLPYQQRQGRVRRTRPPFAEMVPFRDTAHRFQQKTIKGGGRAFRTTPLPQGRTTSHPPYSSGSLP
jgi:hypothetical protein